MKEKPFFDECRLDSSIDEDGYECWYLTLKRKYEKDIKIDFRTVHGSDVFMARQLMTYKEPIVNTLCRVIKSWFYKRTDSEELHYQKWLNQQQRMEINSLKVKLSVARSNGLR